MIAQHSLELKADTNGFELKTAAASKLVDEWCRGADAFIEASK